MLDSQKKMNVVQIDEKFQIDVGAPCPTILSDEHYLYLIFYGHKTKPESDGSTIHVRSIEDEGIVTIKFDLFAQFKFGRPHDEAIQGHPLYHLGLEPYAFQKVEHSSWITELIEMISIPYCHKDSQFTRFEHFIFFFHDTCFEIVAEGYTVLEDSERTMKDEIMRVSQLLLRN